MESALVAMKKILKNFGAPRAESPIEEKLIACLQRFGVNVFPQKKIGKYRADIYIKSKYREIVVECDGEKFHKDKARDYQRDQYMQGLGILVLRFTGSQINRSTEGCAVRVIEYISEIYNTTGFQLYLLRKIKEASQKNT